MINKVQTRVIFDRKHVATNQKPGLVQIEIRHLSKRKFLSTGIKVKKSQFKSGRVVGCDNADILNEKLDHYLKEINLFVNRLNSQDAAFNLSLIDSLINEGHTDGTFLDFMEERIEQRAIRESTKRQHYKVLRFLRNEYKTIVHFSDLTYPKIILLDEYLKKRLVKGQPMMQTTIHTYHKVIKAYINDAIVMERMTANPYSKFKDKRGCSQERTVLTLKEIQMIQNFKTTSILQSKVRDYFIIQCYTGLSYADLMSTDFTQYEKNGQDYILKDVRCKTGTRFFIYLFPCVLEILQKYNFQLPHLAYDVYNRWLKAVACAAGVTKKISTHIGRHSCATSVLLANGVPIETVSKILGHTNIRTTQIYARITDLKVSGDMEMLAQKLDVPNRTASR